MKIQLALLLVAGAFATSCNSQDLAIDKVPAVVVNAVAAQFPDAVGTEWEKKNALYEADFDLPDGTDVTVLVDATGKILMHKKDVAASVLPAAIQTVLQSQYKDYTIDDVDVVEKGGVTFYHVELEGKGLKGIKDKKLVFDANGKEAAGEKYWD